MCASSPTASNIFTFISALTLSLSLSIYVRGTESIPILSFPISYRLVHFILAHLIYYNFILCYLACLPAYLPSYLSLSIYLPIYLPIYVPCMQYHSIVHECIYICVRMKQQAFSKPHTSPAHRLGDAPHPSPLWIQIE